MIKNVKPEVQMVPVEKSTQPAKNGCSASEREIHVTVYTTREVATILKLTPKSVYRLVDRGLLKRSIALRHLRITKKSIEEFLTKTTK
jgi:hypothetical protein